MLPFVVSGEIVLVANRSHAVNASISRRSIDISCDRIALDRDIILDIDLPLSRSFGMTSMEKNDNTTDYAVVLAFVPRLSDVIRIADGRSETNSEFIFIGSLS
jgi:hypothetical protein